MSSDSVQVEPLDVDNYASWMPQMKYYLIGKDLWDIVENRGNSDDDKKKDKKATAAIGLRVKKHHLNTVEKTLQMLLTHQESHEALMQVKLVAC